MNRQRPLHGDDERAPPRHLDDRCPRNKPLAVEARRHVDTVAPAARDLRPVDQVPPLGPGPGMQPTVGACLGLDVQPRVSGQFSGGRAPSRPGSIVMLVPIRKRAASSASGSTSESSGK